MAEGGGLLNRYTVKSRIEGSNPSVSAIDSIPDTWVIDHSRDMGNTFGARGSSIGSNRQVSSSKYPRS